MSRKGISIYMEKQILELKQQGKKIKSIARVLGISRNTVRRVFRKNEEIKKSSEELKPAKQEWHSALNWEEICKKRGQGYTVQQLHKNYAANLASYWAFGRILKKKMPKTTQIAIPMNYEPGRTVQIDYADGIDIVDPKTGKVTKTEFFCGVLPKSSFFYGEFTKDQKLETFIRSQERMFGFFGGVTKYVVHDNLKSGTTKAHRYDPDRNKTYVDFGNHYGFATLPTRPNTPRDKGSIEATIGVVQRRFYQEVREKKFYSLEQLNAEFIDFLNRIRFETMKDYGSSRQERFEYERKFLEPLPKERYEIATWKSAKVHPDCCVQIAKNFYSVPYHYVSQSVRVKIDTKIVQIYSESMELIATHQLQSGIGQKRIVDAHYPPEKLAASRFEIHSAKRKAELIGPNTAIYVEEQLSGERPLKNLRRVQGVLGLAKTKGMTNEALEYATGQAETFKNPRLKFIKECAKNFLTKKRARCSKAPTRELSNIYLHSKGAK